MQLTFNTDLATQYNNQSQIIRVLTEDWVKNEIFCPNCGNIISEYPNNKPVGDFFCSQCSEDYELKSKKDFTLEDMYYFENFLSKKYTENNYIKNKIRQQLQFLRDKGYIKFISRGVYRLA